MEYTIGLVTLTGILYFFVNGRVKKGKLKRFERYCSISFKLHCKQILNSNYIYSLKSVGVLLGVIFGILFLFSLALQALTSKNHPYVEALIGEMAVIFFIVLLGAKTKDKFISETKFALKESYKPIRVFLICVNLVFVGLYVFELITIKQIVIYNGIMILFFGALLIMMFLYFKAIPFIGYQGTTIVYRNIIKQSYLHHSNPLNYFFGYFTAFLFALNGVQWLIMLFVLA
jgi:hypothetical protein